MTNSPKRKGETIKCLHSNHIMAKSETGTRFHFGIPYDKQHNYKVFYGFGRRGVTCKSRFYTYKFFSGQRNGSIKHEISMRDMTRVAMSEWEWQQQSYVTSWANLLRALHKYQEASAGAQKSETKTLQLAKMLFTRRVSSFPAQPARDISISLLRSSS